MEWAENVCGLVDGVRQSRPVDISCNYVETALSWQLNSGAG